VIRVVATASVALALSACGPRPSDLAETSVAEAQHSSAVLFVERQNVDAVGLAHIGARFVQYSGLPSTALPDLLGTPHVPGNFVGCTERQLPDLDTEGTRAEARLLDVGSIDVQAGDRSLRLEPRRFPDLWNVVSGVIYATDENLSADEWHFTSSGNAATHMAGFDVTVRAPDDLASVSISDQGFSAGGSVTLPRHAFQVRWSRGDANDAVLFAVESAPGADTPASIECAGHDEGVIDVDATAADRIAYLARAGATVSLHRFRSNGFTGLQVENAQVLFDTSIRGSAQAE
jgi:hypothetical protein